MSIEPSLSLASSMHAGPGTFALLLGSGVSASAKVPTGWQVVESLICRFASLHGVDAGDDHIAWYRCRTGDDPDYPQLLTDIAPSRTARRTLLSGSFTPTEPEQKEGLKIPTKAHRAIAELVAKGYVKVIVTTNFDRLIETALSQVGVDPQVISSPAQIAGATPPAHARCTIIKVHGDYLSSELKNTVEELARYDPAMDKLLDQVFDQYGLVIVGWSGVWDPALRSAILRTPNRRYSTYWARHGALTEEAKGLIAARGAIEILIDDADTFFDALKEKVLTLADAVDQRPAGTALAVEQLKRYLPDPIHRIRLHDLVMGQVTELIAEVDRVTGNETDRSQNCVEALQGYEQGLLAIAEGAASWEVLKPEKLKDAMPAGGSLSPISDHLHDLFRPIAAGPLPDDHEYTEIFDVLEYLLGVTCAVYREDRRGPKGEFVSRDNYRLEHQRTPDRVDRLVPALLDAGWFDHDRARLEEVRKKYDAPRS
ncbi:MAG: SIR2 family protein [Actinobacteria bacterium]|nr:SIR2 family protein [Actinomycetota bacterium]